MCKNEILHWTETFKFLQACMSFFFVLNTKKYILKNACKQTNLWICAAQTRTIWERIMKHWSYLEEAVMVHHSFLVGEQWQ